MKLVVVGHGMAGLALLWEIAQNARKNDSLSKFSKIYWIGAHSPFHNKTSPDYCAANSTAVIARQGIAKDVSPLGDTLYEAYDVMVDFIKTYAPKGVSRAERYHLARENSQDISKYVKRFGAVTHMHAFEQDLGAGVHEESFSFAPQTFLAWWKKEILNLLPQIEVVHDWVIDHDRDHHKIMTLSKTYEYDRLALCTGALGSNFPAISIDQNNPKRKIPKRAVGHYLRWEKVSFPNIHVDHSFVLTWAGHNMIYHHEDQSIVWGGTTHDDEIISPRAMELEVEMKSLLTAYPAFRFNGEKSVRTGVRSKAQKRTPFLDISEDKKIVWINGLYKNGYTVSLLYGRQAASLL